MSCPAIIKIFITAPLLLALAPAALHAQFVPDGGTTNIIRTVCAKSGVVVDDDIIKIGP